MKKNNPDDSDPQMILTTKEYDRIMNLEKSFKKEKAALLQEKLELEQIITQQNKKLDRIAFIQEENKKLQSNFSKVQKQKTDLTNEISQLRLSQKQKGKVEQEKSQRQALQKKLKNSQAEIEDVRAILKLKQYDHMQEIKKNETLTQNVKQLESQIKDLQKNNKQKAEQTIRQVLKQSEQNMAKLKKVVTMIQIENSELKKNLEKEKMEKQKALKSKPEKQDKEYINQNTKLKQEIQKTKQELTLNSARNKAKISELEKIVEQFKAQLKKMEKQKEKEKSSSLNVFQNKSDYVDYYYGFLKQNYTIAGFDQQELNSVYNKDVSQFKRLLDKKLKQLIK